MVSSILQPPPPKKPCHFQNKENTSLGGKPVAGEMDAASTSTILPPVHTSHGHEMDSSSARQALVPLPLPQSGVGNGVNISFCFYQK